jgi:hypothetical protein
VAQAVCGDDPSNRSLKPCARPLLPLLGSLRFTNLLSLLSQLHHMKHAERSNADHYGGRDVSLLKFGCNVVRIVGTLSPIRPSPQDVILKHREHQHARLAQLFHCPPCKRKTGDLQDKGQRPADGMELVTCIHPPVLVGPFLDDEPKEQKRKDRQYKPDLHRFHRSREEQRDEVAESGSVGTAEWLILFFHGPAAQAARQLAFIRGTIPLPNLQMRSTLPVNDSWIEYQKGVHKQRKHCHWKVVVRPAKL